MKAYTWENELASPERTPGNESAFQKIAGGIAAFPFIFAVSTLSEITADTSFLQQVLYFMPALTVIGIGASVTARRMGCSRFGFWCKFVGPGVFALLLLLDRQI